MLQRGAFREFHDVRAGRRAADERSDLARRRVERVETRRSGGIPLLAIANEQRLRRRRAGRTRSRHGAAAAPATGGTLRVHEHVMHDFARARLELDRLHPLVLGEVRRHLEVLVFDRARRRHRELVGHGHDGVGRAHRPARGILGPRPADFPGRPAWRPRRSSEESSACRHPTGGDRCGTHRADRRRARAASVRSTRRRASRRRSASRCRSRPARRAPDRPGGDTSCSSCRGSAPHPRRTSARRFAPRAARAVERRRLR